MKDIIVTAVGIGLLVTGFIALMAFLVGASGMIAYIMIIALVCFLAFWAITRCVFTALIWSLFGWGTLGFWAMAITFSPR